MKQLFSWDGPLQAENKASLFTDIAAYLQQEKLVADPSAIVAALNERENLGNTLVAPGVAVPHIQDEAVKEATMLFVKLPRAIADWQAGQAAGRFIFVLLPKHSPQRDLIIFKNLFLKLADERAIDTVANGDRQQVKALLQREGE